jgi:hypothetical protein
MSNHEGEPMSFPEHSLTIPLTADEAARHAELMEEAYAEFRANREARKGERMAMEQRHHEAEEADRARLGDLSVKALAKVKGIGR